MRFTSQRDYLTMLKWNRELINKIIDNNVVLYKMNQKQTEVNSYGEATKKIWWSGVILPCMYEVNPATVQSVTSTMDYMQDGKFYFLRKECELRNVYPEIGDIIDFASSYYEIHNTTEVQFYAGQERYNHTIMAEVHLSRRSDLQLDPPHV